MEPKMLPQIVPDYVELVIQKMKYSRKVRQDVRAELLAHFEDALRNISDETDKQKKAEALIRDFGDAKVLAVLIRRGKKRCRPVWQKAVFAVLKVVGIIFAICLLRIGYMAAGRPVISVDYSQWMNEKVRADRAESLNAYYDYQKAVESLSKKLPADIEKILKYARNQEKTPADWEAIENFLKTESKAIEMLRQGASKPYYWNKYKSPEINIKYGAFVAGVVSELQPQLSEYKKIAQRIAILQIPLETHQGNIEQAVNDSIALYRFGQHILSQGVPIEQLVGTALKSLAMGSIKDLLGRAELSAEELLGLQQIIEADFDPNTAFMDWSLEKAFWYEEIQRSFTSDGQGNGRPLLRGIPFAVKDTTDAIKGFVSGFPNRKEVIQLIDNAFNRYDELRKITPYTLHLKKERVFWDNSDTLFFMQIEGPAVQKTIEISWRTRAEQAGVITTLSVLRFQKENGRLPESLNELREKGYLLKMPMDPYSDKSLVYRKTEDGFILYSVGSNFTDDGGIPSTNNKGQKFQFGEHGDWVFWPVQKEPAKVLPSTTPGKN